MAPILVMYKNSLFASLQERSRACSCSLPSSHHNIMLVQQIKECHQVYFLRVAFLVEVAEQLAEGVLSLLLGLLAQAREDPVL